MVFSSQVQLPYHMGTLNPSAIKTCMTSIYENVCMDEKPCKRPRIRLDQNAKDFFPHSDF